MNVDKSGDDDDDDEKFLMMFIYVSFLHCSNPKKWGEWLKKKVKRNIWSNSEAFGSERAKSSSNGGNSKQQQQQQ